MLNGIPEVDLGINTKLSNIERTEAAKRVMAKGFENGKISKKKNSKKILKKTSKKFKNFEKNLKISAKIEKPVEK